MTFDIEESCCLNCPDRTRVMLEGKLCKFYSRQGMERADRLGCLRNYTVKENANQTKKRAGQGKTKQGGNL